MNVTPILTETPQDPQYVLKKLRQIYHYCMAAEKAKDFYKDLHIDCDIHKLHPDYNESNALEALMFQIEHVGHGIFDSISEIEQALSIGDMNIPGPAKKNGRCEMNKESFGPHNEFILNPDMSDDDKINAIDTRITRIVRISEMLAWEPHDMQRNQIQMSDIGWLIEQQAVEIRQLVYALPKTPNLKAVSN